MIRALDGGYELDDDSDRIDVDAVHAFLTRSYWAEGRSREKVEGLVRGAQRVIGAYDGDGRQVGFCRAVTRDAHELYRKFGFGVPGERLMERPPAA